MNTKVLGTLEVRNVLAALAAAPCEMEHEVYVVNSNAIESEYEGDDGEPKLVFDAESWQPVKTVFIDNENSNLPVLLIVYEGAEQMEEAE